MHDVEPFYGWMGLYNADLDPNSPFHEVEHSEFYFDRQVYNYLAHPQWENIGSESLLVKILYADYNKNYAILELFGVWNDLLENDFKLLVDNCLSWALGHGINKFILIAENILNIYLDADDYYEAIHEDLEEGWISLVRTREHVLAELDKYNISQHFFISEPLDEVLWRKLKPWQFYALVEDRYRHTLL